MLSYHHFSTQLFKYDFLEIKALYKDSQHDFKPTLEIYIFSIFILVVDTLLCRKCGYDITTAANLSNIASKLALRQRNDTILGVQQCLFQLFKNPHGIFMSLALSYKSFDCLKIICTTVSINLVIK